MERLPELTDGRVACRLPLSDSTAIRLAHALLLDDAAVRRQRLTEALRDDPSLTLWVVCRAWQSAGIVSERIAEAAAWLAERALTELRWSENERAAGAGDWQRQVEAWSERVAASVLLAHQAAQLADDPREADAAFLLGTLHAADRWVADCRTLDSDRSRERPAGWLPPWLIDQLNQIDRPDGRETAAQLVRRARDRMSAAPGPDGQPQRERQCGRAAAIARRWAIALPPAGQMLVRLTARLSRLRGLETEYPRTLEQEKLAAMKQLAYGASHEINNPLANIAVRAQSLLRDETDPQRRRKLAAINSQAFRAHEMICDMMLFARPPQPHRESVDVVAAIDEAVAELAERASEQRTLLVHSSTEPQIMVWADRTQLQVALKALVTNALQALDRGGEVEISASAAAGDQANGREGIEIKVRDTGPGIPAEARRHIFDPFFSGREAGRGLGFGLSKCWRIVEQHAGRIEVQSAPGQGTTFTIRLPAAGA